MDLVVRDPEGNVIDPDSTGAIQLYRRVSGHLPSQGLSKNLGVQCFWNELYFFLVFFCITIHIMLHYYSTLLTAP